jgi:hypothetical protein
MAGILTIHSVGDGNLTSGHSWIDYQPDGGEDTTYGTWGNNPQDPTTRVPLGNGLHTNLELGWPDDAHRSIRITDKQEKQLFAKIKDYQDTGADGWSLLWPCSAFAADAWQAATGERLADRSFGIISNPSKLKSSILAANKESPEPALQPSQRPPSSRRPVSSAVQLCTNPAVSSGSL